MSGIPEFITFPCLNHPSPSCALRLQWLVISLPCVKVGALTLEESLGAFEEKGVAHYSLPSCNSQFVLRPTYRLIPQPYWLEGGSKMPVLTMPCVS